MKDITFSSTRELTTSEWDYPDGYTDGTMTVVTCNGCGAVVNETALDNHAEWHRIWNGDES